MAEIRPFRALRYNLEQAGSIQELTCPPYDIISEEQRQEYLSRNGCNIIRLELPKEGENPYEEAARTLRAWREEGILQLDMDPGFYLYEEEFLSQVDHGEPKKVRGLVCLVRLEDFANGVVLPHEETLSKAKEDRFQLLSATRCNFSSIYSLYQDEDHTTAQRLENLSRSCPPRYAFSDGLVTHRLWVINDPVAIEALREDFAGRKLYIADGHHRYETGLRYRDTLAQQGAYLPGSQYILMTLTDMADPGLTVFPTHRLVRGLESFDSAALLAACGEDFTLEAKPSREESQAALDSLFQQGRHAFALYDGKSWTVLALKDTAVMEKLLPEKSQAYRTLDVSILHSLVLEKLLGIDKENMANQKNLTYTRSAEEAQAAVDRGEVDDVELDNGMVAKREIVSHPGGVSVAILTEKNELLFVKQFRCPYQEELLELPAGKLEPGEDPFEAMKREQLEETGTTGKNYISLGNLYPTPGYCGEIIRLWACRVDKETGELSLDPDEFLQTLRIPLDKAVEMVLHNEIPDSKTQVGILKTAALVEKGLL